MISTGKLGGNGRIVCCNTENFLNPELILQNAIFYLSVSANYVLSAQFRVKGHFSTAEQGASSVAAQQ
jgi:hypothetical protein